MLCQEKGLEKPARVREMPLGRTHVRHRLNNIIFCLQRPAKFLGERAYTLILTDQVCEVTSRDDSGRLSGAVHDTLAVACCYVELYNLRELIPNPLRSLGELQLTFGIQHTVYRISRAAPAALTAPASLRAS